MKKTRNERMYCRRVDARAVFNRLKILEHYDQTRRAFDISKVIASIIIAIYLEIW